MSLIEKAVERLDQLRRAGVAVADVPAPSTPAKPVQQAMAPNPVQSSDPAPAEVVTSRSVAIDLDRLNAIGMVSQQNPRSQIAEEFRIIKRPLLKNVASGASGQRHGNLIMVTSSLPGEGKSFSALNLALSMSMELDHRVLLVDADVSRPSILNLLGLPPERGLMDVMLAGDVSLPDVMLRTNIEKLTLLPAGMPYPRATELLASDAMAALLDEIATRYADRIVIFDSPPLLATTESRVLATHMGQIVMVVEAGRATEAMVRQSLAAIEQCPIRLMLLNKARNQGAPVGYGYGYYTPYGDDQNAA